MHTDTNTLLLVGVLFTPPGSSEGAAVRGLQSRTGKDWDRQSLLSFSLLAASFGCSEIKTETFHGDATLKELAVFIYFGDLMRVKFQSQ